MLACDRRNEAIVAMNPEAESIFKIDLEENETDYIVRFCLSLLEAFC